MNEIWLGPLLNNNRALLIERCAKLVANNQSDAFIYLAASFPLLENVTQSILDGNRNRGVWGELPVYLFRGLVRRVLYSAIDEEGHGLPPRIPIDRDELPLKRSLISQVLQQLLATNQLKAFAPLATREGCVNSISTLLGEIERAARTPTELIEILAARARDIDKGEARGITQLDFDREVALIYSTYYDLLNQNQFTEEDADQLRALWVLRGLIDDKRVMVAER
jgi:ATP-dependent helicase/DNAse subunit B